MTVASVKRVTPNFGLKIPMFDSPLWGRLIEQDLDIIDAAIYAGTGLAGVVGIWGNNTEYNQGNRVIDLDDNSVWQCMEYHVSNATGTFEEDRTANPDRWIVISSTANYMGNWQSGFNYNTNEFVTDDYRYGVVRTSYVSGASYDADVTDGNIITLIDLSDPVELAVTSADSAADSATASAASATSAATSALAADSHADRAEAAADSIMPDAASDDVYYGRFNGNWLAVTEEAPNDGLAYSRVNKAWVAFPANTIISDSVPGGPFIAGQMWYESDSGTMYIWYVDADSSQWVQISGFTSAETGGGAGGIGEAPIDSKIYARRNGAWHEVSSTGGVPEAPSDGKQYVRKDGAWVVVDTPFSIETVTGDVILKFGASTVIRIKPSGLILTKDDIEVFSVSV